MENGALNWQRGNTKNVGDDNKTGEKEAAVRRVRPADSVRVEVATAGRA